MTIGLHLEHLALHCSMVRWHSYLLGMSPAVAHLRAITEVIAPPRDAKYKMDLGLIK